MKFGASVCKRSGRVGTQSRRVPRLRSRAAQRGRSRRAGGGGAALGGPCGRIPARGGAAPPLAPPPPGPGTPGPQVAGARRLSGAVRAG